MQELEQQEWASQWTRRLCWRRLEAAVGQEPLPERETAWFLASWSQADERKIVQTSKGGYYKANEEKKREFWYLYNWIITSSFTWSEFSGR